MEHELAGRPGVTHSQARFREFDQLVEDHLDLIYRTSLLITRNATDAEDVTQDVLLRAWKHHSSLRDPTKCRAWLQRIAINASLSLVTRRPSRPLRDLSALPQPVSEPPLPLATVTMREALERVPAKHRIALFLRFSEGLTYREIGLRLGCPEGTAKSRIHHALASLRAEFDSLTRGAER
jgi:RNA polymerase sigma-70 factor (ECF subfamily)